MLKALEVNKIRGITGGEKVSEGKMGAINRVQSKKKYVKEDVLKDTTLSLKKQLPLEAEKWHFDGKTGWAQHKRS